MTPEIRSTPLSTTLLGASLYHDRAKSYGQEIKALLDRVYPAVKAAQVPHPGINWVVYHGDGRMFAGLEADVADVADPARIGLERLALHLPRYAAAKHIGPYQQLPITGDALRTAVAAQGLRLGWPMIEIYGHWTSDESKLETDILIALA